MIYKSLCYFSSAKIPSRDANSVHVMKMCSAFSRVFDEVILYARHSHELQDNVFAYYGVQDTFRLKLISCLPVSYISNALYAFQVRWNFFLNSNGSQFVFGRDLLSLFLIRNKSSFAYESHALPCSRIHRAVEKNLLKSRNFRFMVVISEALKNDYIKVFPWLDKNLIVVLHDAADIVEVPDRIRKNQEDPPANIGYVGHLYKGRGIELIGEMAMRLPDVQFHIIGGRETDIDYYKTLFSLLDNISLHGHVPNGVLSTYYSKMDILLAPYQRSVGVARKGIDTSRWMSPMKIFEYMMTKRAIIASDIPVLKEVLRDRENCLLCESDDVDAWVSSIENLIEHPELFDVLTANAYEEVTLHYTWDNRARKIRERM